MMFIVGIFLLSKLQHNYDASVASHTCTAVTLLSSLHIHQGIDFTIQKFSIVIKVFFVIGFFHKAMLQ